MVKGSESLEQMRRAIWPFLGNSRHDAICLLGRRSCSFFDPRATEVGLLLSIFSSIGDDSRSLSCSAFSLKKAPSSSASRILRSGVDGDERSEPGLYIAVFSLISSREIDSRDRSSMSSNAVADDVADTEDSSLECMLTVRTIPHYASKFDTDQTQLARIHGQY